MTYTIRNLAWPVPIFPHAGTAADADADLGAILCERIDELHRGVGIAAGMVDLNGRRVVCHGSLAIADVRPVRPDTIFEIGSVTKIFTGVLLADMVERRELALDDPVALYLPAGVRAPRRAGKEITLRHLATHTSGLPLVPSNLAPGDINNPYADYTAEQLWEFLSSCELPYEPGSQCEYSNLGYGVLGQALAHCAGMEYARLVQVRITGPLNMTSTGITLSPEMQSRTATGYGATRRAAPYWELPALAGAGALRSNLEDLLTFVSAPGVARYAGTAGLLQNGQTGGFRSFMGYDPQTRTGVVVLSNMATPGGVDDIGMHLLNPSTPIAELSPLFPPREIPIPRELFDRYTGVYRFPAGGEVTITREGRRFFAQLSGQGRFEIFAEDERRFFYNAVNARLTFGRGEVAVRHRRETTCAYLSRHSGEQK